MIAERVQITARGLVQGVGFRPFIYHLAKRLSLSGFVQNDTDGVLIDIEGRNADINEFLDHLRKSSPPHAVIEDVHCTPLPLKGYEDFVIEESATKNSKTAIISADLSICNDCLEELFDSKNRRYRYPFINCTNCGPRFTIIKDIPYDRIYTTMSSFTMCANCSKEYHDPLNRRFHAQPNACPTCGPMLTVLKNDGSEIQTCDPISTICALLNTGNIIAIKGIGGYHLACDAINANTVSNLRKRKYREDKPFAVMMENIETIKQFCYINAEEETLLLSIQRPIVLLRKRDDCTIPPEIASDNHYLGVMLPYSPLHYLILKESGLPLVMTSGNVSDEPIAYKDTESLAKLKGIADYFLVHDREIFMRCDDSVMKVVENKETTIRRSRGYAPFPLKLRYTFKNTILACGAFLKNTFCLARENHAFISHHIGDLENSETLRSYETAIEHYKRLFFIEPEVIAYDLHPEYLSTKYALTRNDTLPKIGVQHHHAHIASCMAENGITHKVIGVAFDGLGYGDDVNFWGGEFLVADLSGYERAGHLDYVPMPGGEQAIKEPWRMAMAYLYQLYGNNIPPFWFSRLFEEISTKTDEGSYSKIEMLFRMLSKRINCPITSSMGRLFDGVASLLGLQHSINYEGQAAVKLESMSDEHEIGSYPFEINSTVGACGCIPLHIVQWQPVIQHIMEDLQYKTSNPIISARFHNSVVEMVVQVCIMLRDIKGIHDVVLSGGVFQNNFLLNRSINKLTSNGFTVYIHQKVPCNDGGISLGQAVIASERYTTCA